MRQIARKITISSLVITMCHLEMSHKAVPQQSTGPVNRDTTEGTKESAWKCWTCVSSWHSFNPALEMNVSWCRMPQKLSRYSYHRHTHTNRLSVQTSKIRWTVWVKTDKTKSWTEIGLKILMFLSRNVYIKKKRSAGLKVAGVIPLFCSQTPEKGFHIMSYSFICKCYFYRATVIRLRKYMYNICMYVCVWECVNYHLYLF